VTSTLPSFPEYLSEGQRNSFGQRLTELAKVALSGKLTLLIGAGFSKDAKGFPTGAELAGYLIAGVHGGDTSEVRRVAEKYELAAIAAQFEEGTTGRRDQLKELLREKLQYTGDFSEIEKDLSTIVSLSHARRIFTTNYDDVIEHALGPRNWPVAHSVRALEEFEERVRSIDCTAVLHFNGGIDDPVITEADLRSHRSLFLEQFRKELLTNVLVMVGYSFRDDAIVSVFDDIFDLLGRIRADRASYIVTPISSTTEYEVASRLWKTRGNIHVVPVRARVFFRELLVHMREIRYEDSVSATAQAIRESPEQVHERLRPLLGKIQEMTDADIAEALRQLVSVRTY